MDNTTSTQSDANQTATPVLSLDAHDLQLRTIEIAALAVIFVTAVVGNCTVLFALYGRHRAQKKKKISRIYFFILHLTIADLVTALLNVLPQLMWKITFRFAGGPALCKAVKVGQTLGPYLISYVLVATAFDRYQAVCQPLTYTAVSSKRSRTALAIAWVLSLVFCVPQVTINSFQELSPAVHDCWASYARPWGERVYVTWYSVSVFLFPLALLLGTYSRICKQIWQSARRHHPDSFVSKAKIHTIKQTVVIISVYIACSTPFICAMLWATWDNEAFSSDVWTGSTMTMLTLLSSINSCVNPFVYIAFNPALQRPLSTFYRRRREMEVIPDRGDWRLRSLDTVAECDEKNLDEAQCLNENIL